MAAYRAQGAGRNAMGGGGGEATWQGGCRQGRLDGRVGRLLRGRGLWQAYSRERVGVW